MGGRVSAGRQFVVAAVAAYWGNPPNRTEPALNALLEKFQR